jgi:hypothetical protein
MAKLLVTAEVEDRAEWKDSFRTHGELFRGFGFNSPIAFGVTENNEAAVLIDTDDIEAAMATLTSPENTNAMDADGVKRDTVKAIVLDEKLSF